MANFIQKLINKRNGNENDSVLQSNVQLSIHNSGEIEKSNLN
jgi:hypothetical protein